MSGPLFTLYLTVTILCILVPILDVIILIKNGRYTESSSLFIALLICVAVDCAGYFIESTSTSLDMTHAALAMQYLGGDMAIMLMFFFICSWCRTKIPTAFSAAIILFYSAIVIVALTGLNQSWLYQLTSVTHSGDLAVSAIDYGPLSTVESVVTILLFALAFYTLIKTSRDTSGKSRRVNLLIMAAYALPILVELSYSFNLFTIDPMPLAFLICNSILTWCIATNQIFDVVAQAHQNLVEEMNEAAIVLDPDGNVLYANPSAKLLFPDIMDGHVLPRALKSFCDAHDRDDIYYQGKYYKSSVTTLKGDEGVSGQAALIVDVSHLQELKQLLEVENARIEAELSLATQIQANALPKIFPPWPDRHDFDIFATMDPAKEVGGDFYDFFLVDDTHLGAVIADVSGKGVPAALFMMNAKACIKDRMMTGMLPNTAFEGASDQLVEGNDAELFVTAWAILIDLRTGDAVFANAGHNAPYVYRAASKAWEPIKSRANIVLADDVGMKYRLNDFHFDPGDVLFMYTDGLPEAADPDDGRYENSRIEAVLAAQPDGVALDALLPAMKADVDAFARGRDQFDDITLLALRIRETRRHLTLSAKLGIAGQAADFIGSWLKGMDCPDRPRRQIMLAQDEIFSNIARYAYVGQDEPGDVAIELWLEGPDALIRMSDHGIPFNPLDITHKARDYDDDWDTGGDGIELVRQMMDAVTYEYVDEMNELTLRKRIF